MEKKSIHIAAIPSPGFSHLAPIAEFAKRFVQLHPDFHFTCIIPTLGPPPKVAISIFETFPPNIHSIFLPPVNPQDLPEAKTPGAQILHTVSHSLPHIHNALESLSIKSQITALIVDPFAIEALCFSKEFNAFSFVYYPSAATTLSFRLHLPKLDQTLPDSVQFRDLPEPVKIPGCSPIHGRDLPDPVQDRRAEAYRLFLENCKGFHSVDGIVVNSFLGLEEGPIKALTEGGLDNPPVYAAGPIINTGSGTETDGSECLRWLDKQPAHSVLFVSFGSGGTLSQEQLTELALGLEQSGEKFLWAVRAPSKAASAAYLGGASNEDPLQYLPPAFLERTKHQGLAVPLWAPQIQVLSHNAIGGFLSHCGWNSILESLVNGVPIIAWPLFAEQKMNAKMLIDDLKVALTPETSETGIVEKEEIAKVVRRFMDGEESKDIRGRVKELKKAAASALMEDGSVAKTLSKLAIHLRGI